MCQPHHFLSKFLIFRTFPAYPSYKLHSYKKKVVPDFRIFYTFLTWSDRPTNRPTDQQTDLIALISNKNIQVGSPLNITKKSVNNLVPLSPNGLIHQIHRSSRLFAFLIIWTVGRFTVLYTYVFGLKMILQVILSCSLINATNARTVYMHK